MADSPAHVPVDLVPLRAATVAAIAWYEAFLAGRPRSLADLDVALEGLRALPPMGGRLGRAVALVATGGTNATTEATIAALETLRTFAGLRGADPVPAPAADHKAPAADTRPKPRRRARGWTQPELPGIEGL